jgi:hypothetical protein
MDNLSPKSIHLSKNTKKMTLAMISKMIMMTKKTMVLKRTIKMTTTMKRT